MRKVIGIFNLMMILNYPAMSYAGAGCAVPPSDDEKILISVDFFLKRRKDIPRFRYSGGKLYSIGNGNWESPEDAVSNQPNCCSIIYEDRETFKAREVKENMGENFGGFALISFDYIVYDKDNWGLIATAYESYALDYCGNPQVIISED